MKQLVVFCLSIVTFSMATVAVGKAKVSKTDAALVTSEKKTKKGKAGRVKQAPETFKATFETTKGKFVMEAHRHWSPQGVDRFYELIQSGFFKEIAFFRVVNNFVVQFGIHGDPNVSQVWRDKRITDDVVKKSNKKGYLSFATAGIGTRTTQLFINLKDNINLDAMGFSPVAKVIEGMDVVENITGEYGERPNQGKIQAEGNAYLKKSFPNLDYINSVTITE